MNRNKARILIVDDEVSVTRTLKVSLEITGDFDVRTENYALKAMEAAREFSPDLVILDIDMPELDGGMLAQQFRSSPRFRTTPIIFLTALETEEEEKKRASYTGGERMVAKPKTPERLIAIIQEELARHQAAFATAAATPAHAPPLNPEHFE